MKKLFAFTCSFCFSLSLIAQSQIVYPERASFAIQLAAKEIRKYIYQRTDELLPLTSVSELPQSGDVIVVAEYENDLLTPLKEDLRYRSVDGETLLKSLLQEGRQLLVVSGSDSLSTLRAAYRFAEYLGVSFDLSGDVLPDEKIDLNLSGFDEVGKALFDIQGIQPFHDFHQGPDLWSSSDYRAILSQLPKLGMNFMGFHTYPRFSNTEEKDASVPQGPEPNVWIGLPEDVNSDGTVNWSYPAFFAHSHRPDRIWGSASLNTDQFHAGAQELFAQNAYGSEVFDGGIPNDLSSSNAVFNRVGKMYQEAFTHARKLGIKTAVGTELTMGQEPKGPEVGYNWVRVMPQRLQDRLNEKGINPATRPALRQVYRGIFERIMKTHPLDYYWMWSWEVWSNYGVSRSQINAFKSEMELAQEVLDELGNPFQLGLAGWRIGTVDNHAEFDQTLPPEAPFFGLWDEAEGFEDLKEERVKWAATWPEEDWGLLQPQLELHRFYKDVKAALDKNCQGLIAKHWRTRILGANLYSLKNIQWVYGPTANAPQKSVPSNTNDWIDAFYLDWATRNFGQEASIEIAKILAGLDKAGEPGEPGAVPVITDWETEDEESNNAAPGAITANEASWETEQEKYAFVDQLAALRTKVQGAGNLDRFDYWLKAVQAMKLMAEYGTIRFRFEERMEEENFREALILRKQLARLFEQILTLEIEKVVNESDLGEILNLEILNWYQLMQLRWDESMEAGLGSPLPADANPSREYTGSPFIKATPVHSQLYVGEDYRLKVFVMGGLTEPKLFWRPLGEEAFETIPIRKVNRSVYEVVIPQPTEDFEFYLEAKGEEGTFVFPASARVTNPVVVVLDEQTVTKTSEPGLKSGQLKVFPNPARDSVSIQWEFANISSGEGNIRLLDISGRLLVEKQVELSLQQMRLSLPPNLEAGHYTLAIGHKGETVAEQILVLK